MFRDRRICVIVETAARDGRPGVCMYCKKPIVWFTTAPKGRRMPFNPRPMVLSRSVNPDTGVQFDLLSSESLHFVTCPNQPKRTDAPPRTGAR